MWDGGPIGALRSAFSAQNQVILRALKKHGMVLADNGSSWFLSGAPDSRWNDSDLALLRTVPGSAFEAVDATSLKVSSTSYAVAGPAGTTTTTGPSSANLIANPGFESGLTGWARGGRATNLGRVCDIAHSASCSAPAGRTVTLRLREYQGSTVVRLVTTVAKASGSWQQVSVTSAPANGGTLISLDVLVSLTTNLRAHVDDVSLRRV